MIFQYAILGSWRRMKRSLASDYENLKFDMSHLQETEDGLVLVQSSTLSFMVRTLGAVRSKVSERQIQHLAFNNISQIRIFCEVQARVWAQISAITYTYVQLKLSLKALTVVRVFSFSVGIQDDLQ